MTVHGRQGRVQIFLRKQKSELKLNTEKHIVCMFQEKSEIKRYDKVQLRLNLCRSSESGEFDGRFSDNLPHYLSSNLLFSTKLPCSVASVALLSVLSQFYTNLRNVPFAMNKKNVIGESKPKQSRRQGESAPELPVRQLGQC